MFFTKLITHITHYLLPPRCILCGDATRCRENLCADCVQSLPILPQHCQQCAQFLPHLTKNAQGDTGHLLCGNCLTDPPPFDRTLALFPYQTPMVQIISQLKFRQQLTHAKLLSDLMLKQVKLFYQHEKLPDFILPMPIHASRLRQRGFNQAVEIARPLAKKLRVPMAIKHIARCKPTTAQSGLNAIERQENVRDAFRISRSFIHAHLAVLDDVMTTGHTVRAFCSLLKQRGASKIDVWCCARNG